jgi:hypothetical protein
VELEITTLSKISQIHREKYCMFSLILRIWHININKQIKGHEPKQKTSCSGKWGEGDKRQ